MVSYQFLDRYCPHMSKIIKISSSFFCVMQVPIALATNSLKSHKKSQKNTRRKWDKHCNYCCWAREGSQERCDSSTPSFFTDFSWLQIRLRVMQIKYAFPKYRACWAPLANHWLDWTSSDFSANSRYPELHKAISYAWIWWKSLAEWSYESTLTHKT